MRHNGYKMSKVLSIHYLRGLAAISVVAFHLRSTLDNTYAQKDLGQLLFSHGNAGVDLFFIISGFIIALSTSKKYANNKLDFVFKRIFRIYPVLLVTLVSLFFIMPDPDILNYLRSSIPLHLDYSKGAPFFGYNSVITAWTLTYELYFYFIFLISMSISHKYRTYICSSILFITVFSTQLYFNGNINLSGFASIKNISNSFLNNFLRFSSSPMMIEFIYGMFLYEVRALFKRIPLANILVFTLISYFVCSYLSGYREFYGPTNYGTWGMALFIAAITYESKYGIKESRVLSFLGDISYSLYMVHIFVINLFILHLRELPIYASTSGFSRVLFFISVSIILSYFVYVTIEKPFIKLGKMIISRRVASHESLT